MIPSPGLAPVGAHSSSYSTGQGGFAKNKWHLLKTIEDIREPLGLKGTSIAILRAMLSFLKADQVTVTRVEDHICFASNASLAKRAHVSIQTVERHIAKLVSLGLLARRSSGNGKRWARRDRHGQIVLATGLSLAPLVERHAEFVQIWQTHQDGQTELSLLRDKCSAALAEFKSHLSSSPHTQTTADDMIAKARNLLRRRPTKSALGELLAEISVEISRISQKKPEELRATAPEYEGHKETSLNQSVKKENSNKIDVSPAEMEHAYPRLCAELRFARSPLDCDRLMDDLARQLRLGDIWFSIQDLGPALKFMVLGYLLQRIETIKAPRAYAFRLVEGLKSEQLAWSSLLKKPKPTFGGKHSMAQKPADMLCGAGR